MAVSFRSEPRSSEERALVRTAPVTPALNEACEHHQRTIFIAMIGRDQRYSRAGFGAVLLVDERRRISQAADSIGIADALLDAIDCGDQQRTARRKAL